MPRKNWQKIKLLKLADILRQETDEEHPLTTSEICERLVAIDIPCERRTLSKDINLLNDNGFEILYTRVGKQKAYYVEDRLFSAPELRIFADAVQAASFITEKKTEALINKIARLESVNGAEMLKSNLVHYNTRKHSNENIFYTIDAINSAILRKKRISFRYYDLNINAEKEYRYNGRRYNEEPVALIFDEDNYYALMYSSKYKDMVRYRVDRMDNVEVIEEDISEDALILWEKVSKNTYQSIKMYGGEPREVVLKFEKKVLGSVFDRFGEKINPKETDDGKITVVVKIQISPTFWGWIFQFGADIKIISPQDVVDEYKSRVREILDE